MISVYCFSKQCHFRYPRNSHALALLVSLPWNDN